MTFDDIKNNYSTQSVDKLKSSISNLFRSVKYNRFCLRNQHLHGLYRARKHNHIDGVLKNSLLHIFRNDKEFWNPPENKINEFGRCNDINESLFYCSNSFETCVAEAKPNKGDFITVSNFLPINKCNFFINSIGIKALQELNINTTINEFPIPKGVVLDIDRNLENLFLLDVKEKGNPSFLSQYYL